MHNKTYNTQKLSLIAKKQILTQASLSATKAWVDELDCSKSWARQRSEISVSEMVESHLSASCHFVVIERNLKGFSGEGESYVEIGFSTMGRTPELFLFLQLEKDQAEKIITAYNLAIM